MGKRLNQQRRGKGSLTWKSPSHKYLEAISMGKSESKGGVVMDLRRDSIRNAPLALIEFTNGETLWIPAATGLVIGQKVFAGKEAPLKIGNFVTLDRVPEGKKVFCIERRPGDGGKLIRAAGNFATVMAQEGGKIKVKLNSGAITFMNPKCRAILGTVAGTGVKDVPILKAGKQHHINKSKHKYWPRVSAVGMNAYEHPFGGGRKARHASAKQTVSRHAPPGRKAGYIAARRTGRQR
ncbi:MAG: 50S ribosomal protein L2 [Candidatus Altiarchaeota archaeon]|nr:50S ribosomal protein L2 [Candidatus Altiarchaeota archaeon]